MRTVLIIDSDQFVKEDVRALLQAVRDCEQANFPDKQLNISVEVPWLSVDVVQELLTGIKPPFKHGPMIFKRRDRR